eukprot:TRINITY_DN122493_c0_g1_i1.p1 TRINITY_DN122493_c0_g1~~TRINITY_DN122493_c0_g1_i1.p1  ORF type:complete len:317 (+),score=74.32 TRINITY_DN122493_c0_g1_i1:77-1027(+)
MAKRGATVTNIENITWTQRIRKEEKINAKSVPTFSVRAAVSVDDVPKKFKPGHMDHTQAMRGGPDLQPGEQLSDSMAMESRKWITRQQALPQERHQFPESRGQEIGWCLQKAGGGGRSVPYGSDASKLGLGWLQKDGHGGPTTKLAAQKAEGQPLPPYEEVPRVRRSKDNNIREEMGVPPYATINTMEEIMAMRTGRNVLLERRSLLHPSRKKTEGRSASAAPSRKSGGRHGFQPSGRQGDHSGGGLSKSVSLPDVQADATSLLSDQEQNVAKAMARSRTFLNGPHNKWYHPLSQSDVAQFANAYTECWGTCMFHK